MKGYTRMRCADVLNMLYIAPKVTEIADSSVTVVTVSKMKKI